MNKKDDGKTGKGIGWFKMTLAVVGIGYLAFGAFWLLRSTVLDKSDETDTSLAANPEKGAEIMAKRRIKDLDEKLGLSADQKAQIEAIMQEQTVKGGDDPRQRFEGMHAMREKIRGVLNDDQKAKLDVEEKGRREQMASRMVDRFKNELALNDDQITRIKQIMTDASPAQGPGPGGPGGPGGGMQRFNEVRDKIREVLTDEQKVKFDELSKNRRFFGGPGGPGGPGGRGGPGGPGGPDGGPGGGPGGPPTPPPF